MRLVGEAHRERHLRQRRPVALAAPREARRRCLPWLAFGAGLQRVLRSERARRISNGAMGGLLAASVILMIW